MNRSKIIYLAAGITVIAIAAYLFFSGRYSGEGLFVPVKRGEISIEVTTTGELTAKNSVMVTGPAILATLQIYEIKLQSILPEGTKVKQGDKIASLDPKNINDMIRKAEEDCRDGNLKLEEMLLDTTQNLKEIRDQIKSLEFDLEEAKIAILQSEYEDRATRQKVQNDLKKSERALENVRSKYLLERTKAGNRVRNTRISYNERARLLEELRQTLDSLVIRAPGPGMLIYHKSRHTGDKIVPGSSLSPLFDFIIAELPDLSQMKSVTVVNEIDIDKVRPGQVARVGIDAFPGRSFMGHVTEVANMGMEDPATGTKVFEVIVLLDGTNSDLRPGMTSKNTIVTGTWKNVLYLPVDAVFVKEGSGAFVNIKSGSAVVRQPVVTGPSNEAFIIILKGLKEHDQVSLAEPG